MKPQEVVDLVSALRAAGKRSAWAEVKYTGGKSLYWYVRYRDGVVKRSIYVCPVSVQTFAL